MAIKLTLSVNNPQVIERAKEYANEHGTSLSKLVENYLSKLSAQEGVRKKSLKAQVLSDLRKLRGIGGAVPKDFDYQKDIAAYLIKKHTSDDQESFFGSPYYNGLDPEQRAI